MQDGESEAPEQSANCFYICPIGEPDSATRKRSNQIYKHVVSAALVPLRYKMVRADEMDQSGVITSHIINGLLNEELVVADLTDHNPNVFYEAYSGRAYGSASPQLRRGGA